MCIIACMYTTYYNTQSILRLDWSSTLYRSTFWKKTYQLICIIYIHIPKAYKLLFIGFAEESFEECIQCFHFTLKSIPNHFLNNLRFAAETSSSTYTSSWNITWSWINFLA